MRRVALIVLLTGIYIGCARQPPSLPAPPPEPEPPQPLQGGAVRLALSFAERDALAHHALGPVEGSDPAFVEDRVDRWSRLARTTRLDRVEFVSDRRIDAVDLFLLGEIDLTPAYGRDVGRLREADAARPRLSRAPGWDRTYLIRCDPRLRWTNDPNFRRWFAETIDRVDLVEGLFDGRGAPAWTVQSSSGGPLWQPPVIHPFGSTSQPVLHLKYDPADSGAASVASRMKALFVNHGVEMRLVTGDEIERPELTLSAHQRWSPDPVVAILPLVRAGGLAGEGAAHYLEQARNAAGEARENLASLAEEALLIQALVIPLVRLEAWIASAPALEGVKPGLTGELALEEIWWSR